jgi:hypothetical protein
MTPRGAHLAAWGQVWDEVEFQIGGAMVTGKGAALQIRSLAVSANFRFLLTVCLPKTAACGLAR